MGRGHRVALGGGVVVVALVVVDERDVGLRVLDAELRVSHEVVDGAAGLGRLQTLVGGHGVPEGIHHPDLRRRRSTHQT